MIVKFDEAALSKAFGPTFVEGMRHIVRQLGALTQQTTLPEVAELTDSLTPIVAGLTITLTATNVAVAELAADAEEHRYSDSHLVRRLDEMQAELERTNNDRASLARAISEMRDEFGVNEQPNLAGLPGSGAFTTISASGQITSTVAAGTAPFVVASDFVVANLNSSKLLGGTWAIPGAIGATTPNSGAFTTLACDAGGAFSASGTSAIVMISRTGGSAGTGHIGADVSYAFRVYDGAFASRFRVAQAAALVECLATGLTSAAAMTAATGFGCNGKAAQTAYALGAAATDLATALTLANNLRTMAINNGMGS